MSTISWDVGHGCRRLTSKLPGQAPRVASCRTINLYTCHCQANAAGIEMLDWARLQG